MRIRDTRNKYAEYLLRRLSNPVQMRHGKLKAPFIKMPTEDRLPALPRYETVSALTQDQLKRSSQSPAKTSTTAKKNR